MDMDEVAEVGFLPWFYKSSHSEGLVKVPFFDNEIQLARHIFLSEEARNTMKAYFEQIKPFSVCDADESQKLLNKASIMYREHDDLIHAAVLYTKAIYRAPLDSPLIARAHANRAVILWKLQSYEAAYEDCTCAVEFNCSSMHTVLLRQAKIAWKLKSLQKIQDCIRRFEQLNISLPRVVQDYHEKLKQILASTEEYEDQTKLKFPKFNKIKLSRSLERGRFYVADEPIEAGELLLEDTAVVLAKIYEGSFWENFLSEDDSDLVFTCDNCAEDDIVAFPCYKCRRAFYCSRKCREDHYPIHCFECGNYPIHFIEMGHQPLMKLRILLKTFPDILRELQNIKERAVVYTADELWSFLDQLGEDGELLTLYHNFQRLQKHGIAFCHAINGLVFYSYLANQTDFFERTYDERLAVMPFEAEWPIFVIGLFLRFASASALNALQTTKLQLAKPFALKTVHVEGLYWSIFCGAAFSGIYPWFSLFNHSCDSNTSYQMTNLKVRIYSNRRIAKGEEVTVSYISDIAPMTREERKKFLKQYMNCECCRCTDDEDPIYVKYMGVPCSCGGYCLISDENHFCSKCGERSHLEAYMLENMSDVPICPEAFHYLYGKFTIFRKSCGKMGYEYLTKNGLFILHEYLTLKNEQICNDDVVNSLMVKLAVDLLEVTDNPYVPALNRAVYAAILLDIVAIRKKKGFSPLQIDYKTIAERASWVATDKARKMFDEYCKWLCL